MSETAFTPNESGKPMIDMDFGERKDYGVDMAGRIAAGDSIASVTAVVEAPGVEVDGPAFITGTKCMAWIRAIGPNGTARVHFTITTTQGRIEVECLYFKVKSCP